MTNVKPLFYNIGYRATWVEIDRYLLRQDLKKAGDAFMVEMLEIDQSAVERLAKTLRQHDQVPGRAKLDEHLIEQAKVRRTLETRLSFVEQGLRTSLQWYQNRLVESDQTFHELWQQLHDEQANLLPVLTELLRK